eukprot:9064444-Pyramimonas_sp.AAC.1
MERPAPLAVVAQYLEARLPDVARRIHNAVMHERLVVKLAAAAEDVRGHRRCGSWGRCVGAPALPAPPSSTYPLTTSSVSSTSSPHYIL